MLTSVRVWFKKVGLLRFISHLDVNRLFLVALKKSELPLWYTEGFNPHIYITFNTPLSLGFESVCESFDTRLVADIPFEEFINRLNKELPQGIQVYKMAYPVHKASEITSAKYKITVTGDYKTRLDEFLKQESILTQKKTKKKIKEIDLKDYILEWDILTEGKNTVLSLLAKTGSKENLNPLLLTDAFAKYMGENQLQVQVLREEIFVNGGEEFQ